MDFRNNEQDASSKEKVYQNQLMRKKYIIECPADLKKFKIIAEDGPDLYIEQREIIVQECDQCSLFSTDWINVQDSHPDPMTFVSTPPITNIVENKHPQNVACCYNCPFHDNPERCCQSKRRALTPPFGTDCCKDRAVIKANELCPKYIAKCYRNGSFSNRSINDSNIPIKTRRKSISNDDHIIINTPFKSDSSSPNSNSDKEYTPPTSETSNTLNESPIDYSESVRSPLSFSEDFTKSSEIPASVTSPPPSYVSANTENQNLLSAENQTLPTIDEKQNQLSNDENNALELDCCCVPYNEKSFSPTKTTFECFEEKDLVICVSEQHEILSDCAFVDQQNKEPEKEAVKVPAILPVPQTLSKDKKDLPKPTEPTTVITPKNNNINTKSRGSAAKSLQQPSNRNSNISKKAVQKSSPAKNSIVSNKSVPKQSGISKSDVERAIVLINYTEKSKERNRSAKSKLSNGQTKQSNVSTLKESARSQVNKTVTEPKEIIHKVENVPESDKIYFKECACKPLLASQLDAETVNKSLLAFVEESLKQTEKTTTDDSPSKNSEVLSDIYKEEPFFKQVSFSSTETNTSFRSDMNSYPNSNTNGMKKIVEEYNERERSVEVIPPSKNSDVSSDKFKGKPFSKEVSFSSTETNPSFGSDSNPNTNSTKKVVEEYKERERNFEVSPLPQKSEETNPSLRESPTYENVTKKPNTKSRCRSPCCLRGSESSMDTNAPRKDIKEDKPAPIIIKEEKEPEPNTNTKSRCSSCCLSDSESSMDTNAPRKDIKEDKPAPIIIKEEKAPEPVIIPELQKAPEPQKASVPVATTCHCGNIEEIIKRYFAQRRFQLVYPIDNEDFNFKPGHRCIASQTSQTKFPKPPSSVVSSNKSSNRTSRQTLNPPLKYVSKNPAPKKPGK